MRLVIYHWQRDCCAWDFGIFFGLSEFGLSIGPIGIALEDGDTEYTGGPDVYEL